MEAALPTGTLTMMFTDIEASTLLLTRLGDKYAEALSAQRSILREAIASSRGQEMGTEGDSFFVVFDSAVDAVTAAVEAQRRLLSHRWPDDQPVRVRMGLHAGEPVRHEDGYVGMDVHRAARIAASAHGGQIVLSDATWQLAVGRLRGAVEAVDLGWHRFKDLVEPEHVHQLIADGLPRQFPALKSLGTRVNLPVPPTPIIGRDEELTWLRDLLTSGASRLVTLTGPGGSGKSRLAIAAADSLSEAFSDGVYFVPLAAVSTADVMWSTIAETLGVTGEGRAPPTFFEHIATRNALLVLDNLEQLDQAPRVVAELLRAAPKMSIIVTSRRPLHLPSEHERAVLPLEYPQANLTQPATLAGCSAVQLFVLRAQMVRPGFELTADNAADVVALCRGLDGLPLAIELAAARIKLLSPSALRKRLRQALELASPDPDRPARQLSIRNTIAWSYELLSDQQQRFFRQLGVFSGGCDLEALAAIAAPEGDVLDEVAALVDASLATVGEGADAEPRVALLQTIAAYACEQLDANGELAPARRRHADYYAGLAERLRPQLRTDRHVMARDRLEAELDNLRGALSWALDPDSPERRPAKDQVTIGLRICQAMCWFWYACGYLGEGRQWLNLAVDRAGGDESPELMTAVHGLGVVLLQQGQHAEGRDTLARALAYWREQGNHSKAAMELNSLAIAHRSLGEPDLARQMLEESAELARITGELGRLANARSNLALIEIDEGATDRAVELLLEALELDHQVGDAWGAAIDQVNLAAALLRAGRLGEADEQLRAVAGPAVELGDVELTITVFELFCMLHAERGEMEVAARLLGMTSTMREQAELPLSDPDAAMVERSVSKVRPAGADDTWQENLELGRTWSVEAALSELALARA